MTRIAYRPKRTFVEATKDFTSVDIKKKILSSTSNDIAEDNNKQCPPKRAKRMADVKCFSCREHGHSAGQCPNNPDKQNVKCYACGSSKHSLKKCPSYEKGDALHYAQCFVCKETGHLASQCPSNTRGLYPDGGGCKRCGSVEHYIADCPENPGKQREKYGITVGTIDVMQSADDDDEHIRWHKKHKKSINPPVKNKKKIVSF